MLARIRDLWRPLAYADDFASKAKRICPEESVACWSNGIVSPFSLAAKYQQYQFPAKNVSLSVLRVNLIDRMAIKLTYMLLVGVRADALDV